MADDILTPTGAPIVAPLPQDPPPIPLTLNAPVPADPPLAVIPPETPEPEGIPVDALTPAQQSELMAQLEAPEAPGIDPVDTFSPEQLAELAVSTKGEWSPVTYAISNPEKMKVVGTAEKLADTTAILAERGFKFSDLDLGQAAKDVIGIFPKMAKSLGTSLELGIVNPIVDASRAIFGDTRQPGEKAEFEKIRAKKSAELVSGTEAGITGLAEFGGKVGKGLWRKTVGKNPIDWTPEERMDNFWGQVGRAQQMQNITHGKGAVNSAVLGDVLEYTGAEVDPQVVSDLAAGDPVTFLAFPGGFKVVTMTGREVSSLLGKAQAIRLVRAVKEAQRVAAKAGAAERQAAATVSRNAATGGQATQLVMDEAALAQISAEAAAANQALQASRAAVAASPTATAVQKVADTTSRATRAVVEPARQVIDAAGRVTQRAVDTGLGAGVGALGAGMKTAEGIGKTISAVMPPISTPRALRSGAQAIGDAGTGTLRVAGTLLKGDRAAYSPRIRLLSDATRGVGDVASGAAKGFVMMDVPLAAAASESPEDTAHMPVFGAFFGAVGRLPRAGSRVVQGQLIAPKAWGSDKPVVDYRNFSGLDQATRFSLENGEAAQTSRLSALRDFLKPTGVELHWVDDPQMFATMIERYVPGKTPEWYAEAAKQRGVSIPMVDDAGQQRKVVVLRELDAAPHEAIHGIQTILGERAMGKIDQMVYDEYAPVWDQIGENYATQFFGSEGFAKYKARGEGWQEAVLDITSGSGEWRNNLTPAQVEQYANSYLNREISAEVGDAVLRNAGPELLENNSLPGKLARVLGKTMEGLGVEPFEGFQSEGQGIPITMGTADQMRTALREGIGETLVERRRDQVLNAEPYRRPTPATPRADVPVTEPERAAAEAREALPEAPEAPTIPGGQSPREVLEGVAQAIANGEGVRLAYHSAPGEPAGAITSNRDTRRAVVEAFRDMPASVRPLWEKLFFPDRVVRTGKGIQVMGWSPEAFAANAHKLAKSLTEAKAQDLSPYPLDPKTGSFTEAGWQQLYADANTFVKNQMAGQTGAGQPLVVPAATEARGFRAPESRGEAGGTLDQTRADVINALFGIKLPATSRVGKSYPRNLAGQEVSEATQPGRTSVPVEPRAPFSGARAQELGIEGREIREVNPFRQALAERGVKPSLIEAIQRLNLEYIAKIEGAPEAPQIRANEFTLQAGFQPKPKEPRAIKEAAVRAEDGSIFSGAWHIEAHGKAEAAGKIGAEDGFVTNEGEFLSRMEALQRAVELNQVSRERYKEQSDAYKNSDPDSMESVAFKDVAKFQPRGLEETVTQVRNSTAEEFSKASQSFTPREGRPGGMTGWAYEVGSTLTDPAQLPIVKEQMNFHRDTGRALLKEGKLADANQHLIKAQFYREVGEYATKSGSAARVAETEPQPLPLAGAQFQPKTKAGEALAEKGFEIRSMSPGRGYYDLRVFKDGNEVGHITSVGQGKKAWLAGVLVNKDFQRQGIGETLYRELLTNLRDDGFTALEGHVVAAEPMRLRERVAPGKTTYEINDEITSRPVPMAEAIENLPAFNEATGRWVVSSVTAKTEIPADAQFAPKANDEVRAIAADYVTNVRGLTPPVENRRRIQKFNPETAARIADFYEEAKSDPTNPEVAASYDALIKETVDQYKAITDAGYTLEPWTGKGEPYANSEAMTKDVRENQHLFFLPTSEAFASESNNPMLRDSGIAGLPANDVFRAVHDFFGHAKEGRQFGPKGELDAWADHSEMYSQEAQGALAAETLAQNSWVNFNKALRGESGRVAERGEPGYVPLSERPFAEQKNIVIPEELINEARQQFSTEGEAQFAPKKDKKAFKVKPGGDGFTKAWIQPNGEPVQLGSKWHHEWLEEFADQNSKRWHIPYEVSTGGEQTSRVGAMKAGFVRINLNTNNGQVTFELREKDLRKHKNAIYDFVEANAEKIDSVKVTLFDPSVKGVADSASANVFRFSDKEKPDHIPFVSTEAEPRAYSGRAAESIFGFDPEDPAQFQPRRGETEGLPGLDVGREPLSSAARAAMTRQELRDYFPEAVVPRANNETVPAEITKSPLYKRSGTESEAVEAFAKRLVDFANEYKDNPSYDAGLKWYSEFTPMLQKQFGKDANIFAELLAATSPNTPPDTNFGYAFDAIKSLRAGRFDKILPKFEEGLGKMADGSWEKWYDKELKAGKVVAPPQNPSPASFLAHWIDKHDLKPRQTNGKLYGQHSIPVLQVFTRRWLSDSTGPKTRNFVENLLGTGDEATIDVWADRTMRWAGYEGFVDRWRILPENKVGVSDADFAFSQKAFRRAAEELGIKPSALQGALWFAEKQRWADNGWGRLDLGDFRREMDRLPLYESGFRQRTRVQKGQKKETEQKGFQLDVEPRVK